MIHDLIEGFEVEESNTGSLDFFSRTGGYNEYGGYRLDEPPVQLGLGWSHLSLIVRDTCTAKI